MPSLFVKPRSRLFHGHDWVYASDVDHTTGAPLPGDVVTLKDRNQRVLGAAIYNPKSQIVARRFSFRDMDLNHEFFTSRITRAVNYRNGLDINQNLCRLIWSESDGLPGVILDRYNNHLVLQTLTLAMGMRQDLIVQVLREVLSPESITVRNDVNVRLIEGLPSEKATVFGTTPPPFSVNHAGITLQVDIMEGQKTGLYLDQLDNYLSVGKRAKGRRVLDCFSNQGGFAQACAVGGATEVSALDASEPALALASANAAASGLNLQTIAANAFDWLKAAEQRDEKYDLIILDPPSFSRSKGTVTGALRGYKEIHLRAIKMLAPDGILSTFSCSHHISLGEFYKTILDAAVDARKTLRLVERHGQRTDHPIIAGIPETEYLRGYTFQLVAGW
jgi:23S rRNA (cytosine1962-C5)-methyltransferase